MPLSEEHRGREIISFGDSMEERTATIIVSEQLKASPKSIMMVNSPSPAEIIGQLHMLTKHMGFLCESSKRLDLRISSEQATRFARSYMESSQEYDNPFVASHKSSLGQNVANEVVTASASG